MSAKTCGNCKHGDIPPPKMSKHKVPRVLENYPGRCGLPLPPLPMVSAGESYRVGIWAKYDATRCPCWEPKGGE